MLSRVLNTLLLVLLGVVVGAVGTSAHQVSGTLGGVAVPWGLALAIGASGCLIVGVRLVTAGRLSTIAVAVGVVGAIALFSLKGPGGSVLIPDNVVGQVWVFAPVVIAAAAIAWPELRRHLPSGPAAAPAPEPAGLA
jgi:membrane-bound ClpP family serine protease